MPLDPLSQLSSAIHSNDASIVRRILSDNPDLKSRLNHALPQGSFGATALLEAVYHHNIEIIDALLEAGADPNARSHWWAGSFGVLDGCKPDLAPHLISRGAKITPHAA